MQEPDYLILDYPDQSKVFRFLLVSENNHRVVRIIHLSQLFLGLSRIEVVFYEVDVIVVLLHRFVLNATLAACDLQFFPNIASVFVVNSWGNRIVFDEHAPSQEHVRLLDFLVYVESVCIFVNAKQNVRLV